MAESDDLARHVVRMPRYRTHDLTVERLQSALETLWTRVRERFVKLSGGEPVSTTIHLDDADAFRYPPSLKGSRKDMYCMRGNRLAMRHIRKRALEDEELRAKYKLRDVHLDWDEDCGGKVHFRCDEGPTAREDAAVDEIAQTIERCDKWGSSMHQFDPSDYARFLLVPRVRRRIEGRLGFPVHCSADGNDVVCTWYRPCVYDPPESASWDHPDT